MSEASHHPSSRKMRFSNVVDASFTDSGQLWMDTDKSNYVDFATTPYTPHIVEPPHEAELHVTNRNAEWTQREEVKKLPFVTSSPHVRECLAEFLGALIVIGFGLGVNSQMIISEGEHGSPMTVGLAWGVAVLMGIYIAEKVSGGHIISVITVTHAVYGRMPLWKVPGYIAAQTLGAFVASALIYVLHYQKLTAVDPEKERMHMLFVTSPNDVSNYTAFYSEALATFFLMASISAITDQHNRSPGPVGTPFAAALLVMALGSAFSMNTGLAVSLNRDLGPRIFAYLAGYHSVFTEYSYYFWIPIVAPLVGGVLGAGAYLLMVELQHPREQPQASNC